jgi:hypothetical protein
MTDCLEAKRALSLEWRREDHAGGGAAIGQKLFDEILKFGHRCEDDLQQEGVVACEVVAFLYCIECRKEFEEWFVACALAGEAHEGCNGKAEGMEVDVRAITTDEFKAFEAAKALSCGRGRETDSSTELSYGKACVVGELSQNLAVDLVDSCV